MDRARLRRRTSSPPQLPSTAFSLQPNADTGAGVVDNDVFEADASPSRKQKLLSTRNARFPGKRLSLTGISNKFNQLIAKNEQPSTIAPSSRHQENTTLHKSKSTGTIEKRGSLGILNEQTHPGKSQSLRRREEIPIYQDHIEKPGHSPPIVSSPYIDPRGEFNSPLAFDSVHDNLSDMRLRELSLNVDWSPAVRSPPLRSKSQKRSAPAAFDTDDYIEHIERELQQTRDEAYSPLTRRPVREKLKAANKENERLQKELAQLRERFETEVKKTVEHKMIAELELRRKVKDLEVLLEDKDHAIRELQYQHEERRLDNNIITSLKATIERLEQDKIDMEQINLGMSKRNEVLTQLLAMSPTKLSDGFQLRSPVREKRNGRPISLILPRQTASPTSDQHINPASTVASPRARNSADISPIKLSADHDFPPLSSGLLQTALISPQQESADPLRKIPSPGHRTRSRRSTLHSDISTSSVSNNGSVALFNEEKQSRRKARRFMAGSTQLKPLLLPSMAGEGMTLSSASAASSPRSWKARAFSDVDVDDTILPEEEASSPVLHELALSEIAPGILPAGNAAGIDGPGPAYAARDVIEQSYDELPQASQLANVRDTRKADLDASLSDCFDVHSPSIKVQDPRTELSFEHLKLHNSQYSLHTMPAPETPESLIALPQPLFSAKRGISPGRDRLPSGSPCLPSGSWQVSIQKKRKNSFGVHDISSPAPKVQCSRQLENLPASTATSEVPRSPTSSSSSTSASKRLSQIRTTDNFVGLLRQKNFATRPLAALTIRTIYTLLSTCTSAVRDFRRDPFALARRVLANAWRANWKVFGKASWWVLGLFIQPESKPKARAPIDWDQYDGESIATRYCSSVSQSSDLNDAFSEHHERVISNEINSRQDHDEHIVNDMTDQEVGWGRSMYLWGKFSAALVLAVGGAVIKGPNEMLKDTEPEGRTKTRCKSCKSCSKRVKHEAAPAQTKASHMEHSSYKRVPSMQPGIAESPYTSDFEFRCQLGSSSLLEDIQQPDYDSTLRPETALRGRVGSLFSPTPSPGELTTKLQELTLSSAGSDQYMPQAQGPEHRSVRDEG